MLTTPAQGTTEVSRVIAEFVVGLEASGIPPGAVVVAERGVLDYFTVAIAGSTAPGISGLVKYAERTYAEGRSTLLASGGKRAAEAAALVNSATGHVLDFDDMHEALGGHPTVAVLPAALAVGEEHALGHRNIIDAYILGVEVAARLGRCLNPTHYERGWHPTATLGIFGAAAAAARLLRLDVATTQTALGIAASMAAGIKGNFGTFMKPGQVARAAANGTAAAYLAAGGITASPHALEGVQSFSEVFNGAAQGVIDWSPMSTFGKTWLIADPGLVFKLYPCCGSTHAPIDAMLTLVREHELEHSSIEAIDVLLHPRRLPHINRPNPASGLEAKFSLQYAVAVAATGRPPGMADFVDGALADDIVRSLRGKVRLGELPEQDQILIPGQKDCFATVVSVRARGRTYSQRALAPQGFDPAVPITTGQLEAKFHAAVPAAVGQEQSVALLATIHSWLGGGCELRVLMESIADAINAARQVD